MENNHPNGLQNGLQTLIIDEREPPTSLMVRMTLDPSLKPVNHELQQVDVVQHGVIHNCFMQHFESLDDMLDVYKPLRQIRHDSLATPIHLFRRQAVCKNESERQYDYYLAMELGNAENLKHLAEGERKKEFCRYRPADGTAYSLSSLYITILRGLIKGIWRLQTTNITASLDLKDIYIVQKGRRDTDGGKKKKKKTKVDQLASDPDDDTCEERCVFAKYMTRDNARRTKLEDWPALAKTIQTLNGLLGLTEGTVPHCQLKSLISALQSRPHSNAIQQSRTQDSEIQIKEILRNPIFWRCRRTEDFICHVSDILKSKLKLGNLMDLNAAFGEDWEDLVGKHIDLGLLKKADSEYAAETRANNTSTSSPNKKLADSVLVTNEKFNQEKNMNQCIHFMRNTFCHFFAMKYRPSLRNMKIEDTKDLENIYSQIFPKAIYALAPEIARIEERMNPSHGNCIHGVWPVHI